MLRITDEITINDDELVETFVRASGPGGQNVNKVATAVELRFDIRNSPNLPEHVRQRMERLSGARLTRDGVVIIRASRFRTQELNRADARARLVDLAQRATIEPRPRIKTRPSRASKERRLQSKERRGQIKQTRRQKPPED